jgi:hypothetical protein
LFSPFFKKKTWEEGKSFSCYHSLILVMGNCIYQANDDDKEDDIGSCSELEKKLISELEYRCQPPHLSPSASKENGNESHSHRLNWGGEMDLYDYDTGTQPPRVVVKVRDRFPEESEGLGVVLVVFFNADGIYSVIRCAGKRWIDISSKINRIKNQAFGGHFSVVFYDNCDRSAYREIHTDEAVLIRHRKLFSKKKTRFFPFSLFEKPEHTLEELEERARQHVVHHACDNIVYLFWGHEVDLSNTNGKRRERNYPLLAKSLRHPKKIDLLLNRMLKPTKPTEPTEPTKFTEHTETAECTDETYESSSFGEREDEEPSQSGLGGGTLGGKKALVLEDFETVRVNNSETSEGPVDDHVYKLDLLTTKDETIASNLLDEESETWSVSSTTHSLNPDTLMHNLINGMNSERDSTKRKKNVYDLILCTRSAEWYTGVRLDIVQVKRMPVEMAIQMPVRFSIHQSIE